MTEPRDEEKLYMQAALRRASERFSWIAQFHCAGNDFLRHECRVLAEETWAATDVKFYKSPVDTWELSPTASAVEEAVYGAARGGGTKSSLLERARDWAGADGQEDAQVPGDAEGVGSKDR